MKKKKIIVGLIIALLIIALILIIAIKSLNNKNNHNNISSDANANTEEQKELEELKKMGESDRMQRYVSKYITYLEEGNYDSAYSLLYDEFKKNYFKTQADFEKYVKNKYPDIIALKYTDIQRLGTYYVLTVEFEDIINNENNFTQLFVIKENGFDDFCLSFQAE